MNEVKEFVEYLKENPPEDAWWFDSWIEKAYNHWLDTQKFDI